MQNSYDGEYISKDQEQAEAQKEKNNQETQIFLDEIESQFAVMQNEGYAISKQFADNKFIGASEQTSEKLAEILQEIKSSNQQRNIFQKTFHALLPAPIKSMVDKGKMNVEKGKVKSRNITKTTDEIFSKLDEEIINLTEQAMAIAEMEDNYFSIVQNLIKLSEQVVSKYEILQENGEFEGNSVLEFKYKDKINTIETHIKSFEQRIFEIRSAKFASQQTISQVKEQIPHLRQELIGGLATSAFIDTISKLQSHTENLSTTISEINITNSELNKNALLNITDTTRQSERKIKTIEKQQEINSQTIEGMEKNLLESVRSTDRQNALLVDINKKASSKNQAPFQKDRNERDIHDFSKSKRLTNGKKS